MGFNTTVVVLNDALDQIRTERKFGARLAETITRFNVHEDFGRDVAAGNHANVARVIETHHADNLHAVLVGGNTGHDVGCIGAWNTFPTTPKGRQELLQGLARVFGLEITIKRKR